MSEFIRNHPIKLTIATAFVVVFAIIRLTSTVTAKYTKVESRVANIEQDFVDYELKDVPTMQEILERVDENVQKLIDEKK